MQEWHSRHKCYLSMAANKCGYPVVGLCAWRFLLEPGASNSSLLRLAPLALAWLLSAEALPLSVMACRGTGQRRVRSPEKEGRRSARVSATEW